MSTWIDEAIFYHLYPLGACGAPRRNDFRATPTPRLAGLHGGLDHLAALGTNALLLGPVFESTTHGYDTADYYRVDRRLGDNATLARLAADLHSRGMRLVLDGVFNHVGRDFWAFQDVRAHGRRSPYADWFARLDFAGRSPAGDPFSYEGWNGHYSLVKLNLRNEAVRAHLFEAVGRWIDDFGLDGLRLDAADQLDPDFIAALAAFCRARRPDFWLMGEIIHGDYRQWANPAACDSVTNYECYKGLYSSLADQNYFEIAYSLDRQFGPHGLYRGLALYNFADNHDVDRVAARLPRQADLYPLYALLFTMPGVPSIYYGSEWGLAARRSPHDDSALRPALDPQAAPATAPEPGLAAAIARLAAVRRASPALRHGDYRPLLVKSQQLAFLRQSADETVAVVLNAAAAPVALDLPLGDVPATHLVDLLNPGDPIPIHGGQAHLDAVWPHWARVLAVRR